MKTAPRLVLRLLGGFVLERDGISCKIAYEKGRGLLAYLALEPGRTHQRTALAAMFWPDLTRDAALSNLRLVLHNLRQTLASPGIDSPVLHVDRENVRLATVAAFGIDTVDFFVPDPKCPSPPALAICTPCLGHMEHIAGQYRGEFMAGFSLPDCPDFEAWLQVRREAAHMRALTLLARLAECHERMGNYAQSLPFALRFLELEPWNEDGLRRAMRLYALNGQQAAALAQCETSCRALKRDLGIAPSAETRALAARIREGELSPTTRRRGDSPPPTDAPLPIAEKRQVTVLYCELSPVDTEDPDETLSLLAAPQACCSELIRRHSGFLVQIRGGSLLAYFGYPQASENAARLGVQAALAVSHIRFPGLEVRTAVHTGMVICGDLQIPDTIGATSGLAIRLRQFADDGEVTISGATQALVAGYFKCSTMGTRQLPGTKRSLEAFSVEGESGATSRLEASGALTPLVGRKNEIATLLTMWQSARNGTRRIALVRGEAGIGKSRLVHTLKGALRGEACVVRELHCLPEHSHSPFYPLTALFGATLGFTAEDSPEARFDKLAAYVEHHYASAEPDTVPLLAGMLSVPLRTPYQASASSPQQQREKLLKIVLGRLFALASRQPVLLVVEDLHWADPSTLELLLMFVTRELATPMLAVLTARPGFVPPWREAMADTITLGALGDADTNALIATLAPGIDATTSGRIVERADGIPLFAEELARQSAGKDLSAIPSTLQDLLATRLDDLGRARSAAQAAACIGREFTRDLLRRITPFDEATLDLYLAQLQSAGLVLEESVARFYFRHALLRDAAYHSQTRTEREARHRHIAEALKASGGDVRPELLAQHWAAGGEIVEAIACWIAAGKLAARHSASEEAIMHFRSGLALIETLPETAERIRLELDLQIGLGAAASAAQGYASAEGADAYARAMALCSKHDSGPDMFRALWGLWGSASSRSGYADALILARRLLDIAQRSGDPMQGQQASFAMGNTLYWQGEFIEAKMHLGRVGETYLADHHPGHVAEFGEDAGITSASYSSWVLWLLGYPEQALETSHNAVALARRLGHPYSLAYALTFATILHCRMRQPEQALALGDETLTLATEHGFPLWQIGATLSSGWALAMQNHPEGIESLQLCVEATRAAMGGVTLVVLEPLADAHALLGFSDRALNVCDEALTLGRMIGDHQTEAELHRLRGEALLGNRKRRSDEAAACFELALAISRKQKAKSLELRAAMSLARLWQQERKQEEARRLLAEVYGRFTEGFATPDLQSARELLDALGQAEKV